MQYVGWVDWNELAWVALGGYALGCFTTGYYLVRSRTGQDLRELGSGSLGARNAGRVLGAFGFLVTLLGDVLKGALAVSAARHFCHDSRAVDVACLAVVAGHVWPVQLRLRGGKGAVTSLGALVLYDFRLAIAFAGAFAFVFLFLRKVILPGLFAFVCLPPAALFVSYSPASGFNFRCAVTCSLLAGLVLLAHRKNIAMEFSHLLDHHQLQSKPKPGP